MATGPQWSNLDMKLVLPRWPDNPGTGYRIPVSRNAPSLWIQENTKHYKEIYYIKPKEAQMFKLGDWTQYKKIKCFKIRGKS